MCKYVYIVVMSLSLFPGRDRKDFFYLFKGTGTRDYNSVLLVWSGESLADIHNFFNSAFNFELN